MSGIELLGLSETDGQKISRDEDLSAFELEFDDHDHDDHDDDDHNHDIFTSWGIETPKIFPATQLKSIFESLKDEAVFGKVVRSKGKVQIDTVNWVEFDFVPNALEIRASEPDEIGRITVIGHDLNQSILDTVF